MTASPTLEPTDACEPGCGSLPTRVVRVRGFSLVELVIVIVIVGVIAAIAIPRISRGADGAAEAALVADLRTLRGAIELYAAEHGGVFPSVSPSSVFVDQLTLYSDDQGNTNPTKTPPYIYGPYLAFIPTLKLGEGPANGRGKRKVAASVATPNGWIYDEDTGNVYANTGTMTDRNAILLSEY